MSLESTFALIIGWRQTLKSEIIFLNGSFIALEFGCCILCIWCVFILPTIACGNSFLLNASACNLKVTENRKQFDFTAFDTGRSLCPNLYRSKSH
jgi:hypothetical protein